MAESKTETRFAYAYEKKIDSMPRKTGIVAALVRDRYVADAVVILEHTPRRAARPVRKAVESAAANLMNKYENINPKTIRIARISVTAGTRIRRYVPASRGRALPFEKVSSNIFVEVAGEEKPEAPKKAEKKSDKKSADVEKKDAKKEEKK